MSQNWIEPFFWGEKEKRILTPTASKDWRWCTIAFLHVVQGVLGKKVIEKISMTVLMTRLSYMVSWPIFSSIYGMENIASYYASQVWFSGSGQEACCFAKRVATLFCLFCMFFG